MEQEETLKVENKIEKFFTEWTEKIVGSFHKYNRKEQEYTIGYIDNDIRETDIIHFSEQKPSKNPGYCRVFLAFKNSLTEEEIVSYPIAYIRWELTEPIPDMVSINLTRGLIELTCPKNIKKYFKKHLFKGDCHFDKITRIK